MLSSSPLLWEREGKSPSRRWKSGNRRRRFPRGGGSCGKPGLVFRSFHGPAFSTAFRVMTDDVRTEANGDRVIQMLVDGHGLTRQSMAPAALVNLPPMVFDRHG